MAKLFFCGFATALWSLLVCEAITGTSCFLALFAVGFNLLPVLHGKHADTEEPDSSQGFTAHSGLLHTGP